MFVRSNPNYIAPEFITLSNNYNMISLQEIKRNDLNYVDVPGFDIFYEKPLVKQKVSVRGLPY